jgi:hypothetical protein
VNDLHGGGSSVKALHTEMDRAVFLGISVDVSVDRANHP